MERYICENVFVPLRSGPSHKSEMTSQVLFGEKYTAIDKSGNWMKIETSPDRWAGWIDTDHLHHTRDEEDSDAFCLNMALQCYTKDDTRLVLEAGCEVHNPDFINKKFYIGKKAYRTTSEFSKKYITASESLTDTAMRFINSPYIWGGRIPSGIDCSGFTKLIYKIHGIIIPHDSRMQSAQGKDIDFIDEAEPGDLVFFDNERGYISHVGMIISKGLVIHASGRVRIDTIDHQGIFKQETGNYSHHLRTIKRIIGQV